MVLFMQIRQLEENNGILIGVMVVSGYSFLLASFVVFIVGEKESKVCASTNIYVHTCTTCLYVFVRVWTTTPSLQAKHLQFVSGVNTSSYWLSTAIWDVLNAVVPVLVSTLLFYAFQLESYQREGLLAVFLLLVCIKSSTCLICVEHVNRSLSEAYAYFKV